MTRATSKAAFLEERETGKVISQEQKILEIIAIGGDWSLKEIKAAYTAKWGEIETSSVAGRCNTLKGDERLGIPAKIFEVTTRKCSISGKVINALSANKCTHEKYKGEGYMMASNALKAMQTGQIAWRGMVVDKCECGADISQARRVPVMTFEQYQGANK